MLQLFEVADLTSPQLLHKEVIGTRGSTSEAATNHLAFNFFRPRGLLALPMTICEGGAGKNFGMTMTFSGLLVYLVDLQSGFTRLGGVPHVSPAAAPLRNFSCHNWWTQSSSVVQRSIFMDDYVFSVALDEINISKLSDLEHPVANLSLTQ